MRISGIVSGMDTDSMVQELMKAESIKVDRVKAEKQILEWKKDTLNSLNKDFANFILDSKKDLGYNNLGRPGSMDWIKSAVSSDESLGTATAGKGAFGGKHTVTVNTLAKGVLGASEGTVNETTWEAARTSNSIGDFTFKINDKEIKVSESDSLKDIAKKINASGAGVQASFDDNLGKFFLRTEKEGSSTGINFDYDVDSTYTTELDKFLEVIDVNVSNDDGATNSKLSVTEVKGKDGNVTYNGVTTDVDSNQFTFNGVTFDAKAEATFTVTVNNNTDAILDKVKSFVENYNKMIEKAGSLINEKKNRNYQPLTEDQKEAMKEKEIELWEEKAKSGVISRDMDVERMLSSLRSDLYKNVDNASGVFKNIMEIGITTQKYKSGSIGGQLEINEDKLKDAISKDADGVMEILFGEDDRYISSDDSKLGGKEAEDTTNYSSALVEKRANSGLFTRIFDNITMGMKDIIAKSGPGGEGDLFRKVKSTMMTDFVTNGGRYSGKGSISDIDDDMLKFSKRIDAMNVDLFKKENMYYARFTAMEKAMQRAQSQSGWLMQQMQ